MSFFEDLGDAFESNMGWFMLANAVNTNRIASAQQTMAIAQREASGADQRMKERELDLLEKQMEQNERWQKEQQALAEAEKKRQELEWKRQETEARKLKQLRALLAYCEILIANDEHNGFTLATLEILVPSLEAMKDACSPQSDDSLRMQQFSVHLKRARTKFLLENKSSTCISMAMHQAELWITNLNVLSNIGSGLSAIIQRWIDSLYSSIDNPSLLQVALSVSESPLRAFFPKGRDTKASQAAMTDRQGLIRCSEEDWQRLHAQCAHFNESIAAEAKELVAAIEGETDAWFSGNAWLRRLNSKTLIRKKSNTTEHASVSSMDLIQAISSTNHYRGIAVDSTIQPFLAILEQASVHSKSRIKSPELTGLRLVPELAIQCYRELVVLLADADESVQVNQTAMAIVQCIANSDLPNCFEEGVSRLLYINQETLAKQERERVELKQKRLAEFKARNTTGTASTVNPPRRSPLANSRTQNHGMPPSSQGVDPNRPVETTNDNEELISLKAWILAGNLLDVRKRLSHRIESENVAFVEAMAALEQVENQWERLKAIYCKVDVEYEKAISPKGKIDFLKQGSYPNLEAALREFHDESVQAGFHCGSELREKIDEWIENLRSVCEFAGMCLSWSVVSIPLEEMIRHVRPRDLLPADVYINALCAMASSDGDFCNQEKWTVHKWVIDARIDVAKSAIVTSIEQWCQFARERSLQRSIAQSVVDVKSLRKTPLAPKLLQGLSAVLRADAKTTAAETKVFDLIKQQLA